MNQIRIFVFFISLIFYPSFILANSNGVLDALVIENEKFAILGWACQSKDSNTSIQFYAGELYLGSTGLDEKSEPAVSNSCNNQDQNQRFKFFIPDDLLNDIAGIPVHAKTYDGIIEGDNLSGSHSLSIPHNYQLHPLSKLSMANKILFIGAHPDDEAIIAPLLGDLCSKSNIECKLYIITPGGAANDNLCENEEIRTRSLEMAYSAQYLSSDLKLNGFTNEPCKVNEDATIMDDQNCNRSCNKVNKTSDIISAWDAEALELYNTESISLLLQEMISNYTPDYIITHDPEYGTSNHLEHKATGELVLNAIVELGLPPEDTYILASKLRIEPNEVGFWRDNVTDNTLWSYSTDNLLSNETQLINKVRSGWDLFLETLDRHPSQFSAIAKDRAHPLHLSNISLDGSYSKTGVWIGNDLSGRLVTLQSLADFCKSAYGSNLSDCSYE